MIDEQLFAFNCIMPDLNFWLSFFGGGIVGGLVSATIAYFYNRALAHDARTHLKLLAQDGRKREFRRRALEWRTKIYRCVTREQLGDGFPMDVSRFGGDFAIVEEDLPEDVRNEFHRRCDEIVRMTDADIQRLDADKQLIGKAEFLQRIEKIVALVH